MSGSRSILRSSYFGSKDKAITTHMMKQIGLYHVLKFTAINNSVITGVFD